MKAQFNNDDILVLTPETLQEDEMLKEFYSIYKTTESRKAILFDRFKKLV